MKGTCRILLSFFASILTLFASSHATAQILVADTSFTVQHLVEDILLGTGVTLTNIEYTGSPAARGSFHGAISDIGLDGGVILSTGKATHASGPNFTPVSDQGFGLGFAGDADLAAIAEEFNTTGVAINNFDASILEFDFQVVTDSVYLQYVFASDEYMLYVGLSVNDIFAVLLSGPGITGEQNLALIPGTKVPVTINTVNAVANEQFYVDNESHPLLANVEYNGFTTPFLASASIMPNQVYHMRIGIADAADDVFDSAVLLQRGSLTSAFVGLNTPELPTLNLSIYPNPATDNIIIQAENQIDVERITLTDLSGKTVYETAPSRSFTSATIPVSEMAKGMYVLHLTNNGSITSRKVAVR